MSDASDVLEGRAAWACHVGDCLPWLRSLPDDCVDLVVTSPPYEDARKYLEGGHDLKIARKTEEWVSWMLEVCAQLRRVCVGLVAIVCEGRTKDYRYSASPLLLAADLHRTGYHLCKPCVYYRHGIPGKHGDYWSNKWEPIIVFRGRPGPLPWADPTATGRPPKYGVGGRMSNHTADGTRINKAKARKPKGGRRGKDDHMRSAETNAGYRQPERVNPGNVIRCKVGGGHLGPKMTHANEAPFPESLVEPFVRCFCPPGGVTLDPFAGSGTTLAVAVNWGRRAVGCDLRPSQVEIVRQRLSLVTPTLFPED